MLSLFCKGDREEKYPLTPYDWEEEDWMRSKASRKSATTLWMSTTCSAKIRVHTDRMKLLPFVVTQRHMTHFQQGWKGWRRVGKGRKEEKGGREGTGRREGWEGWGRKGGQGEEREKKGRGERRGEKGEGRRGEAKGRREGGKREGVEGRGEEGRGRGGEGARRERRRGKGREKGGNGGGKGGGMRWDEMNCPAARQAFVNESSAVQLPVGQASGCRVKSWGLNCQREQRQRHNLRSPHVTLCWSGRRVSPFKIWKSLKKHKAAVYNRRRSTSTTSPLTGGTACGVSSLERCLTILGHLRSLASVLFHCFLGQAPHRSGRVWRQPCLTSQASHFGVNGGLRFRVFLCSLPATCSLSDWVLSCASSGPSTRLFQIDTRCVMRCPTVANYSEGRIQMRPAIGELPRGDVHALTRDLQLVLKTHLWILGLVKLSMVSLATAHNMSPSSASWSPRRSRTQGVQGLYGFLVEVIDLGVCFGVLFIRGAKAPLLVVQENVHPKAFPLWRRSLSHLPVLALFHSCSLCPTQPCLFPFLSLFPPSRHLRCHGRSPVLCHRPSSCVCLHTRLDSREYPACSSLCSCFSWTDPCSWMVSILCCTTMSRGARCRTRGETSQAKKKGMCSKSQVHNDQNVTASCETQVHENPINQRLTVPPVSSRQFVYFNQTHRQLVT